MPGLAAQADHRRSVGLSQMSLDLRDHSVSRRSRWPEEGAPSDQSAAKITRQPSVRVSQ